MANTSVLKLVIDDREYNASIKDAKKGMQDLEDSLKKAGKSFADCDKDIVEYAQAIGKMETASNSAKAKIAEMTRTFTDLSVQYKNMTEQEKQSPFGQALAQSLETLKGRIKEGTMQLSDIGKELGETGQKSTEAGGFVDQLTSRLTLNIDAFKLLSVGLAGAKAALDVAKDAFFASEANVDEWGRTVESAKSLYEGFLTAINTGDISGYLTRIDEIVKAAREAYDELDLLSTMKTIQAPQMSAQQAENERMRSMIMTGRYIAPMDGRANTPGLVNGQQLTADQIRVIESQLKGGMDKVVGLVGNEVKQTGRAIDAIFNRQAKELGMSLVEFRKGTSSMSEFDKRVEGAKKYNEWQYKNSYVDQTTGELRAPRGGNPYAQYKGWDVFRVDGQKYNDLVRLIQQRDQQMQNAYSMQAQAYRSINRAEGTTVRNILNGNNGGSGNGGGGRSVVSAETVSATGSIDAQTKKIQDLQKAWRAVADDDSRRRIKREIDEQQYALDIMTGKETFDPSRVLPIKDPSGRTPMADLSKAADIKMPDTIDIGFITPLKALEDQLKALTEAQAEFGGVSSEVWQMYQSHIDEVEGKITRFKKSGVGSADATKESWREAAQAMQAVGSALQQIEDPSIKIAGLVGQAIANIALGFAQATASDSKLGVFGWIAAITGGMATMLSTISAIHSATGFEQGGIVEGNSFSGDKIPIMANAGEVVLTRAMTNNLAGQLQGTASNIHLTASVQGEQIILAANRTFKRKGQGEIVTWKN